MRQYESYKDSGVEWIGNIPSHWEIVRLKTFCSLKGRIGWNGLRADEFKEKSYAYLVTGQDFNSSNIEWHKCYQIDKARYDEDPFIQLSNGDLLITKDGTIGKIAKVSNLDKPACLNSGIFVMKQKQHVFNQGYLYWLLCSDLFKGFNAFTSSGSTILHLYQNVFEKMPMTVPPVKEQEKMAIFLDNQTCQVDRIIKSREAKIKLLEELKASIISNAVTKGIRKDIETKDSGIEWIGRIPKHWETVKLKRCTQKIGSGKTPSGGAEIYTETGIMFIRSQNVYNDGLRTTEIVFIPEEIDKAMSNTRVLTDDVLLNITGGSIGRCCHIEQENINANVNQHVCIIRTNKDVLSAQYLHYCIISNVVQFQIRRCQTGSNREELNFEQIANFFIPFPNIMEQIEIANYLNNKCKTIDINKEKILREISLLKEYRASLITEVVTGKRKVI